jgi:hypothetical protein
MAKNSMKVTELNGQLYFGNEDGVVPFNASSVTDDVQDAVMHDYVKTKNMKGLATVSGNEAVATMSRPLNSLEDVRFKAVQALFTEAKRLAVPMLENGTFEALAGKK